MPKSQIAFLATVFFIAGVALASRFIIPGFVIQVFSFFLAACIALGFLKRRFMIAAIFLFALSLGVVRATEEPYEFSFLDPINGALGGVQEVFVANINRTLPEPHAAYLSGLLVGARTTIPYEIKEAFRATGTSHIIALSGYNVTIIAENIKALSGSMAVSAVGIVLFVLMTGASSSVVRAAIMGILVLVAKHYGRDYNARNSLIVAVGLMIFINPTILFGDVGFQLSVLATAGLIYGVPYTNRVVYWLPKKLGIREAAASTLAAQVATLPLVLYYFGRFSPLAPIVNILVLVTIPATMLTGFLVGMTGFISGALAQLFAWPTYLLLAYQLSVIQFFASLNF